MKLKYLLIITVLALSINAKTYRVGLSGQYYPFSFYKNGKLVGYEIDLSRAIAKKLGYKVEFKTTNFDGLFGMLQSNKIDTIANQIGPNKKRRKIFLFTNPYSYTKTVIIVKNSSKYKKLEDLYNKKIGATLGSNYQTLIVDYNKKLPKNKKFILVTYSGSEIIKDLEIGRINGMAQDRISVLTIMKDKKLDFRILKSDIAKDPNAFPFTKANKKLKDKVNNILKELYESGEMTKISMKWFNADISK